MAIVLKVTWVDQSEGPDLFHRIRQIGGDLHELHWKHTGEQAIDYIERGQFCYYVDSGAGTSRLDVGQTIEGDKYLKIDRDSIQRLLDLPPMPEAEIEASPFTK